MSDLNAAVSSPIIELRQYTLRPGKRDTLIELFENQFIEPQEALGMELIGQFRNLDDPNKFVWLRGFSDMASRADSLSGFYDGPVWKFHREAANATIIDNDNVLLLRPAQPSSEFALALRDDGAAATPGLVISTIYHIDPTDEKEAEFIEFFHESVAPLLNGAGVSVIASFVAERQPNSYPRLPVREGEHVFVWFSRFSSQDAHAQSKAALAALPAWRDSLAVELSARIREPQTLRLSPTRRSRLR
jgi:quinol monooxygenase YgiN